MKTNHKMEWNYTEVRFFDYVRLSSLGSISSDIEHNRTSFGSNEFDYQTIRTQSFD